QRTGWACGGMITPGFLAMYLGNPVQLMVLLGLGLAAWTILALVVRITGIYGRQRLGTAMLIALLLKIPLAGVGLDASLWLGWVVPGLIGADMDKQGVIPTLAAVISTGVAAAMVVRLLLPLLSHGGGM
ncbi:MAG: poly-gamma-glutamate biosynthesis protein PgsC/CapC, partial [Desulfobacterales bacterium]|nr:poly-gamma-glutamate biosynthesis protein PgsC/CapC [Desulfobacterales bacterium]